MPYDIFALSAHPDDIEVAMGGTAAKLSAQGFKLLIVNMCDGEPTRYGKPGIRKEQAAKAAKILGVDYTMLGFQDRFITDTLEARLQVAKLIRQHQPKWIFSTTECGVHPDHKAMRDITDGAVFYARLPKWDEISGGEALADSNPWEVERIFYYYCRMEPVWQRFDFAMDVSDFYAKKKAAMAAYEAVFSGQQSKLLPRAENADRFFGGLVGVEYAEIFQCRSPVLIDDLSVFGKARFG